MTKAEPSDWAKDLEEYLKSLRDNKVALADLRSGRGRPLVECVRLHRWIVEFVPDDLVDTARERAAYTVAALFASYPDIPTTDGDLGSTLAAVRDSGRFSAEGIGRRLVHLARAPDSQTLCRNLSAVVPLIDQSGAPLSWARLADDINWWDRASDRITRRWLRAFYRVPAVAGSSTEPSTESTALGDP